MNEAVYTTMRSSVGSDVVLGESGVLTWTFVETDRVNRTKITLGKSVFEFYLYVLPIQIPALHNFVYNWLLVRPEHHASFESLFIHRMANITKFPIRITCLRSLLV
jgi:hypothetical protein